MLLIFAMPNPKRQCYLDAARGVAMFTVVYSHILLFCLPSYEPSALINFLRIFFLSGFFFISGYLSSAKELDGTIGAYGRYVLKKLRQLLIPTLVCLAIYVFTHGVSLVKAIGHDAKWGYWFTFVLFEMCVIFGILMTGMVRVKNRNITTAVMLAMAIGSLAINRFTPVCGTIQDYFCLGNLTGYLPYFLVGFVCRHNDDLYQRYILNGKVLPVVFLALVVGGIYGVVPSFITGFSVVLLAVYIVNSLCKSVLPPPLLEVRICNLKIAQG